MLNAGWKPAVRWGEIMWIYTKRNYHGGEKLERSFPWVGIRWVVHREGELRGVCECWDEESAERICAALNAGKINRNN